MPVDISDVAGFPLHFDPATLEIMTPGEMVFEHQTRKASQLQHVLLTPEAVTPETDVYHLYYPVKLPAVAQQKLDAYDLTYSLVGLPVLRIGREYAKTSGHYHPSIPGTTLGYPEVYTQLYGRLYLLLQKRDRANPDRVADVCLVEMTPGFSITVPPDYAHVLINASDEPALMAGLYGRAFKPDYAPVQRKRGLAYYVVADGEAAAIEPNPNYKELPPLNHLDELTGTPFAYAEPGVPVWTSFMQNPHHYAFLTQADAVTSHFA